ncbi:hypothetical protein BDY19DRAFT_880500 [Irpex rosettiformis]|uniref:Uncharacterized protein n=1 Tax=Irpex rosettiformis TaxID=378272 RepID=A0ACB8UNN7_9APHY|nr:hypothetical protein BDY19DRAFT_880500 [Irpex rosettiformis]
MAKLEVLTVSSLLELFNLKSAYYLGYALLFGSTFWVTFVGGVIALKALPRHQFGALQHRTFPVYFNFSIALTGGLLVLWHYGHPTLLQNISSPEVAEVAQAYSLAAVVLAQGINQVVIGPMTSKTMFQRHKLEKEEGKAYNDPGVSGAMRSLNRTFSQLHGISSLLNLGAFFAIAFHGLWIANKGVGNI